MAEKLDQFRAINIRLDSQGDYIPDGIIIKQGDVNGRLIKLLITDYGTPVSLEGITAIMSYERPDKVKDIARFTTVGDHLECAIPEKAGEVVGDVLVELQVQGANFIVGARNFTLKCEKSPASYEKIVNSNSYQDLLSIADDMMMLQSDAKQIKADAESTLKAQAERGEKIIQENEKAFTDAHADFESRYVAAEKARDGKYVTAEAERDRKFNASQSSRANDYSSWKTTIASDAESRVQAKEQLFTNSINAANSAKSKFDTDASQALDRVSSSIQAKEQAYDDALKADKAKYASSLVNQEQAYTKSLSEHESSWESQQASAKSVSDGRINKLDNIIAAYEGETPLTPKIADAKYQPKGDYATKSDLETLADSEALSSLASKEELKSYIKDESSSIKTDNLADGSVTPDKLSETYLKPSDAESKYQPKGDYASKSTATTTKSGLISYSDKAKLNSIESGAQKNTVTSVNGKTGAVTIEEPAVATTSKSGLISASDQAKLNGIQAGAQKNTVTSVNGQTGAVTIAQPNLSNYVTTQTLNSYLAMKQDKGTYVTSDSPLKIVFGTKDAPSSGYRNTLYIKIESK